MRLFEKLFTIAESVDFLDLFLSENIQSITDFYNDDYKKIIESKESIERFILLKSKIIEQLDFNKSYNKAFISILLDLCERFNFISAAPRLYSILEKNDLNIGHRLQASLLFLYNVDSIPTLVGRFDSICQMLQSSVEHEEDNSRKAVATFLNYFSIVVRETQPHIKYVYEIKLKIEEAIYKNIYSFLNSDAIVKALKIQLNDAEIAFNKIQFLIDDLLNKTKYINTLYEEDNRLLIENDTEYSKILGITPKSFISIRKISNNKYNSISEKEAIYDSLGRGVAILENEAQMYSYMSSYGPSHHAKMLSALENIPFNEIQSDLEIFDWSCGQGLASIIFFEYIQKKLLNINIKVVNLIEPSHICLKRAALHVRHFSQSCSIKTVCKNLDSLTVKDVICNQKNIKIHFFSNILDVEDFSILNLIGLIENSQKGRNYFICVSPYITDIKTERIESFNRHFMQFNTYKLLDKKTTSGKIYDEYWNCNNNYKNLMCQDHPYTCEGKKKWTRVIRTFKIDL